YPWFKSAEGLSGLCISHGGGWRCQHLGCTRGAHGGGLCTSHCALVEDIGIHGGATLGPVVHKKMEEEVIEVQGMDFEEHKKYSRHKPCKHLVFYFDDILCNRQNVANATANIVAARKGFNGTILADSPLKRTKTSNLREQMMGQTERAEGRTDFCIAHGGGRRCSQEGCGRAARGKTGLCIRHGGGMRCQKENCTKSAEGLSGLCISHGGGRRCQHPECAKGAQGSTMFCKAHGGGKRCKFEGGCTKGAEESTPFCKEHGGGKRCSFEGGGVCPKSVHRGFQFCVAHGGDKRCAFPECTKSARGRTDFCVRHGGGKRCQYEGCAKSAQGATDFCKAHGGGKRCSWGQPESEFGQGESPCYLFARGLTGQCTSHGAQLVQDTGVHGGATLGPMHDP
ncbi:probable WRKY transcription factor 19, partial [Rhododendron vialii]|uniref:probable WRKY transcription factor 19 n=1 Tax=Rhododendron vialii TaxID=182163 RepID=UPI00265E30DA